MGDTAKLTDELRAIYRHWTPDEFIADIAAKDAHIASLEAENARLVKERDEARSFASLGCYAADDGAHSIVAQGSYKFCHKCGQTIKNPSLQERARSAEAEVEKLTKALQFYADPDQYTSQLHKSGYAYTAAPILSDNGKVAARALDRSPSVESGNG